MILAASEASRSWDAGRSSPQTSTARRSNRFGSCACGILATNFLRARPPISTISLVAFQVANLGIELFQVFDVLNGGIQLVHVIVRQLQRAHQRRCIRAHVRRHKLICEIQLRKVFASFVHQGSDSIL